ncbi:flavodoxin family protein [Candidatus Stoquefichus massiliensis]|uniref:flavodoxin family protein n=1 Tax=Candidatus Stoquefichus massiliensis TaxID=1470350 RepID=UPI000488537C|nr:flavodoxin family protein [Candidatus Stoquefichus massiliensis]
MKLIITDIEDFHVQIDGEYKIIKPHAHIQHCIGCFGCWVKTPGKCIIRDGFENTGILMSQSIEMIFVSQCYYGSVSPFVKMVQDRAISYIHPDFVIREGEMHHKRRYQNVITLSAYLYGDKISDAEKETARSLMKANALNYDGKVKNVSFYNSLKELEDIVL